MMLTIGVNSVIHAINLNDHSSLRGSDEPKQ